ncbi:MAG: hypothetical protein JWP97_2876 [Labilithrix sp.]|nr:hypothetical protein [Labilithrix sp.]
MNNTTELGTNRTGIDMSPIDNKRLIEGAAATIPSSPGDEQGIDRERAEYVVLGATIGSVPPPGTLRGAATSVLQSAKGQSATVLIDRLGQRLAFERMGTRLYGALISKLKASQPLPGGPTLEDLERIQRQELEHFEMLREHMLAMGADPTAMTPSADVSAVSSLGLLQVIGDPRMNLKQSLEAILVAELVDNDAWALLAAIARGEGQEALATRCEVALAQEEEHLANVRAWVQGSTVNQAGV